jgi:hypothetical protein
VRALLPIGIAAAWIATAALLAPRAETPSERQAAAARELLASLSAAQRKQASAEFDSTARTDWHFVPRERAGVALGDLDEAQRRAARELISSGLSAQGVATLDGILVLEQVLLDLDRARGVANSIRDPSRYFVLVCGEPGAERWSWRVEGHHVSVHFTHVGGALTTTPLFWGTNPAEVKSGPRAGLAVLGEREKLARALAASLTAEQRPRAGSTEVPADVLYQPSVAAAPTEERGIPLRELSAEQRAQFTTLFELHARDLRGELADGEIARFQAALDHARFVWHGTVGAGKPCYYALERPGVAIEYVNVQNDANHAHCVWRDFARDLGSDPLREHMNREHAPAQK